MKEPYAADEQLKSVYESVCELSRQDDSQRFLSCDNFLSAYNDLRTKPIEWVRYWASLEVAFDVVSFLIDVVRPDLPSQIEDLNRAIRDWLYRGNEDLVRLKVRIDLVNSQNLLGQAILQNEHSNHDLLDVKTLAVIEVAPIEGGEVDNTYRFLRRLAHESRHIQNALVHNLQGCKKGDDACPEEIDCRLFQELVAFPCKVLRKSGLDEASVFSDLRLISKQVTDYYNTDAEEDDKKRLDNLRRATEAIRNFVNSSPVNKIQVTVLNLLSDYIQLITDLRVVTPLLHRDCLDEDELSSWSTRFDRLTRQLLRYPGFVYLAHEAQGYIKTRLASRHDCEFRAISALSDAFLESSLAYRNSHKPRMIKYISASLRLLANRTTDSRLANASNTLYTELFCNFYKSCFFRGTHPDTPFHKLRESLILKKQIDDKPESYISFLRNFAYASAKEIISCEQEADVIQWVAKLDGPQSFSKDLLVGAALSLWCERKNCGLTITIDYRRFEELLFHRLAELHGLTVNFDHFSHGFAEKNLAMNVIEYAASDVLIIRRLSQKQQTFLNRMIRQIAATVFRRSNKRLRRSASSGVFELS